MSVVPLAIDAVFADPNLSIDIVYFAGGAGAGLAARGIIRQPDQVGIVGQTRSKIREVSLDVRRAEIGEAASDDLVEVGGKSYKVVEAAFSDSRQLIWTLRLRATS